MKVWIVVEATDTVEYYDTYYIIHGVYSTYDKAEFYADALKLRRDVDYYAVKILERDVQ